MKNFNNTSIILLLILAGNALASLPPEGVSSHQWQKIKQQIHATKYHPQKVSETLYVAKNKTQGWQVHFNNNGITTINNRNHHIGMKLLSIGSQRVDDAPDIEVKGDTLYYHHSPRIKEWWVNSADKTEQWFGIRSRPITGNHELKINIQLDTDTQVNQEDDQLIFTSKQGLKINYDRLKAWDSQGTVLSSRMQLADNRQSFALIIDDHLATYPITIDPSFTQNHYIKPAVTDLQDTFGLEIDIDGGTMVVGVQNEDSASTLINGDSSDNNASNAGAAYVFVRSGLDWVQQAYLKASNADAGDYFGQSVAVSGNTVVVGASFEQGDANSTMTSPNNNTHIAGAAYVFTRSGTTWTQQAYLKPFNVGSVDYFGSSVAIDGNTIAVGAYSDDGDANSTMALSNENTSGSGAVHIFTRSGTTWTQQAYLKASNAEFSDSMGLAIDLDEDTVVVGAPNEDGDANSTINAPNNAATDSGAAYVFVRDGTTWTQQGYLKAHNADAEDDFGDAVVIDGDTIVVGSSTEDGDASSNMSVSNNNADGAGAAYVFIRDAGVWSQQAYLKASNAEADDRFATSVAIAGETVVVGASGEDGDTNSTMASPNNNWSAAGAAYVFTRNESQWQQKNYLKSDNHGSFDSFGGAVAIDQGNLLVGAGGEDGDASSTAASPNDNTFNAGAVYLFQGRYYIGGQVVGLPFGGSLELSRNGTELLDVTHNGAYEFPTDVGASLPFTVSISNVPTGYTCSIINNTGHVSYDDVTDVDVFCSTNSFSVGGSVSGLTGTGLVLRNNDVYDVIISNNGSFAFNTEFANGTPYEVVVHTQPTNNQTCSVTGGSGTITGGDANVSVVCVGADYDIGGTVTGLTGTLVLQNNGGDDLTITNDGSFTFNTPITDGNSYAVSILSQPNGQTCAITAGSGTVSGEDVIDVAISCLDNTYFIGGTVSGLSAVGLVLQNNGGDDLTITSNGSFVFSQPLTNGTGYNVTINSQPNGQNCAVNNSSGTLMGDDVVDVAVNCVDNTYLIGVDVSGLTGPGLVLQNNGTDDLVIMHNGVTPFTTQMDDGSSYNISVISQPDDPGNTCEMNDLSSGIVAGSHVLVPVLCGNDLIFGNGFE